MIKAIKDLINDIEQQNKEIFKLKVERINDKFKISNMEAEIKDQEKTIIRQGLSISEQCQVEFDISIMCDNKDIKDKVLRKLIKEKLL